MKKRTISMFIAIMMAFILLPTEAFADRAPDYISEYNAPGSWDSTKYDLAEENLSGNGWSWDAKTGTLTLNGFQGADINFGTYYGLKIVLAEGSINKVNHLMLKPGSTGIVIEGTGELIVNHFDINPYDGPVTLASSLQLTGRRYGLDAQWEPLMIDNASWWPVTADGESAMSFRDYRISSSGLSVPITPSIPDTPTVSGFTDVKEGAWYADPVTWAVENSITNGATDTTFAPGRNCTEAEILTFLWRAAGEPAEGAKTPVANVRESDYFYQAAMWANDMGMIDPGAFDPAKPCTRSQAVKFIWAAFLTPEAPESGFTDVPADADYAGAVSWAVANGITNGTSATTFGPNDTCTRGQIVTFLHRAYVPGARLTAS